MVPGDEIGGRFVVDEVASAGSYTTLYRAHDRITNEAVAVKMMSASQGSDLVRFSRESRLLAEQHHPGIVRYIAHGVTPQGAPWLAMEWLDGETLGERVDREALPYDDAITVAAHVAAALCELHRLGVVHRDIKPCNLFLPDGDVSRVKVLDLGIARVPTLARRSPTRVGTILGTPGYMAPEQVRGAAEIDARADVFALGCVLFECLTGRPAIDGDSVEALLGRTLLEDCPRLATVLPQVHPGLDDLVAHMVARDPADRPADGAAVVRALEPFVTLVQSRPSRPQSLPASRGGARTDPSLDDPFSAETSPGAPSLAAGAPTTPPAVTSEYLGDAERRLLSVVLVADDDPERAGNTRALRMAAESFGAQFEGLWSGMAMVVVRSAGAATDQAARGARCALALRTLSPGATLAMATGWAQESGHGAIGEVIDRASELLHHAMQSTLTDGGARPVRIGEVDAGLLDARFEVRRATQGYELLGEREVVETARAVLGRTTPCVGRQRELTTLAATLDEVLEEPVARAVLLTGPAGIGKSRVRHEFEAMARERCPDMEVWSVRGDPQRAGSAFVLLAPLLRRIAGIQASERVPVRRQKLRARVGRNVPPGERQRVAEFLGEVIETYFPDVESARLRNARVDASLMAAEVRRAWVDFVTAEADARPLMLVLEDIQWADVLSVRHVDAALRAAGELPLLVLAVGRPEVHEAFPRMWIERGVQELRVGPLTRRSVETLARHCLGDRVDGPTLTRIVERAGGNAFYLEELIRSVAAGRGLSLPGTVLAMVHARLGALDAAARRVLRAASVFGERFWRNGVAALLGDDAGPRTPEWLAALEDREVIIPVPEGRFPGDQEYVFQSPQLRDAAYGMLTDADRMLGHRLAAAWLERTGETDLVTLADHLERAGSLARAVERYVEAARLALDASELGSVLARAERGISCGASGPTLGALLRLQAEAHRWRGDNADAVRCGTDAMRQLPHHSAEWYLALRETVIACGRLGDRESLSAIVDPLRSTPAEAPLRAALTASLSGAVSAALDAGLAPLARDLARWLPSLDSGDPPTMRGDALQTHAAVAGVDGDLEAHLVHLEAASGCYDESGNDRELCNVRVGVGRARQLLGMHERSLGPLREARAAAKRLGLHHVSAVAELHLATAHLAEGALDDARGACERAVDAFTRHGNRRMAGRARGVRSRIATALGELDRAVVEGERATQLLEPAPADHAWALACLAEARIARREVPEAIALAEHAARRVAEDTAACHEEAFVMLTQVDALTLLGRVDAVRAVVAVEHARLTARAERIANVAWRERYLSAIREHARIVTLHRQAHSPVESTAF